MKFKALLEWLLKDRQTGKTPLTQSLGFIGILSIIILFTANTQGVDVVEKLEDARSYYFGVPQSIQGKNDIQARGKQDEQSEKVKNPTTSKARISSTLVSTKETASKNRSSELKKEIVFPRIALYPLDYSQYSQQSGKNHNNGRGVSKFVTSSLMITLAKSDQFELLDRSQLSTLFAEKSRILLNKRESSNNEALAKLPLSDFTLVGSIFSEGGIQFYTLKLIRNKTGEVLGVQKNSFNTDNIQEVTQLSLDYVHKLLGLVNAPIVNNQNKTKNRRKVAFGHFIDISEDDSQLGQGQIITDQLIEKFVKNKNYEVLSRTQMLPLLLEEYLRQLQYTDEFQVSRRANVNYLVHGKYKFNKFNSERPLSIYLYLDLIENGRDLVLLKARNWDDAFALINQAINDFLPEEVRQVSTKDKQKSRELIIKAMNLRNSTQKRFYLKNGKLSQFKIKEFAEALSLNSSSNEKKYDLSKKLINQALEVDPGNQVAKQLQGVISIATEGGQSSTKGTREIVRYQDSSSFGDEKPLLEDINRGKKGAILFADFLGSEQAEDVYNTLIKEKYLSSLGNFLQHKKSDQVFNRAHTLSLGNYDADVSIQVFEKLRSLNYRPSTQIRFKKPKRYYKRDIHKNLRSWNQVSLPEKHNTEAVLFSNLGGTLANVYLNTETDLPSVEFYPESANESRKRMLYRVKIGADAFSTSAYLDTSYLRAKVLLAYSLCKKELGQCETGNMVHAWVVENTAKANLKGSGGMYFNVTRDIMEKDRLIFLAADAIDRVDDANLTEMFRGTLLQEEYYVNKAMKKLQKLIH